MPLPYPEAPCRKEHARGTANLRVTCAAIGGLVTLHQRQFLMNPSAETVVAASLDADERLLWAGQPRQGVRLRAQDALQIPFSLLWGGFALFWEYQTLTIAAKAPGPVAVVFPLFGLPFVLIGLYMIFGRFFVDARSRARTFYGVTNERVLIISGLFAAQTKSLPLRSLGELSLTQHADGSGTLSFGPAPLRAFAYPAGSWPGADRYLPPSFDMIERVKDVYDIIRTAQKTP